MDNNKPSAFVATLKLITSIVKLAFLLGILFILIYFVVCMFT